MDRGSGHGALHDRADFRSALRLAGYGSNQMSEEYFFEWSANGITKIISENADEAQAKFDNLTPGDLVEDCEFEVLSGPETKADRDAAWEAWKAKTFPKTEAANG
jgi:hypothetical protein